MQYLYNVLFYSACYASNSQLIWKLFFFFLPDYFLIKTFLKNNNKQNLSIQKDECFSYLLAFDTWRFICYADSEFKNKNT